MADDQKKQPEKKESSPPEFVARLEYDTFGGGEGEFKLNVQVLTNLNRAAKNCKVKILQGDEKSETVTADDMGFIDNYQLELIAEGEKRDISLRVLGTDIDVKFTLEGPKKKKGKIEIIPGKGFWINMQNAILKNKKH